MSTGHEVLSVAPSDRPNHQTPDRLRVPRWAQRLVPSLARRPEVILAAAIALALALRLPTFINRDVWVDEVVQYEISSAPSLRELFARLQMLDRNPPGYALLCHAALQMADSKIMLRMPSLVAGIGTVMLAWYVGKTWLGTRGAALMSIICAICPSYVFYSGEARPYSVGLCAIFGFLLCLGLFRRRPTPRHATLLALSAMIGVTLQYANIVLIAVVLAVTAAFSLCAARANPRIIVQGAAVAALTAATAAINILAFMCPQIEAIGPANTFGNADFARYFFDLTSLPSTAAFLATNLRGFVGHTTFSEYLGHISAAWYPLCLVGFLPTVAAFIGAFRRKGQVRCVVCVSLATLATFVLLAGIGAHPFGAVRHTLPLTPLLFLPYVSGILLLQRRHALFRLVGSLAFSLLVLQMGVANLKIVPGYMSFDYRTLKAYIEQKRKPNEWVVVAGPMCCHGLKHLSGSDRWDQLPWFYVPHSSRTPHEAALIRTLLKEAFKNTSAIWFVEDLAAVADPREFDAACDETCRLSGVIASHWMPYVGRR